MASVTTTLNPLHLEDLEPHRFEDLVRQLLYDFRPWRSLEATGRGGSDEGFDARGLEVVPDQYAEPMAQQDDDGGRAAMTIAGPEDRLWLIQCKREKRIGPAQIVQYVANIPQNEGTNIYGVVFATACDFSKRTRDAFREACAARGIQEWHLWGRAEIEDRLFRPSNDHLLFAYFGISLRIRKRSLKSQLSSRLATKRRLTKLRNNWGAVLIRDSTDERYPYLAEGPVKDRRKRGHWVVLGVDGLDHDAIRLVAARHFAVLKSDKTWDYAERMDDSNLASFHDPWAEEDPEMKRFRSEDMAIWERQPESERAWLELLGRIPFDNILAIDEDGDETFEHTQIYTVAWDRRNGPFAGFYERIRTNIHGGAEHYLADHKTGRLDIFERKKRGKP